MAAVVLVIVQVARAPVAYAIVDETTLVVIKGQVEVVRASGEAIVAATDTPLRVGDRVRTEADTYAAITYFDGSTTQLEPATDITITRLDRAPPGGQHAVAFSQAAGTTWNQVDRLVDATIRFETTTRAAKITAQGTAFIVRVAADGRTTVVAVADLVMVEGNGVTQELRAGSELTVATGQPPSPPQSSSAAGARLVVAVGGDGLPFLIDESGRGVGVHPGVDALLSQIPGATSGVVGGQRTLEVPQADGAYRLILRGRDGAGPLVVTVTLVRDGQSVASGTFRAAGRVRPPQELALLVREGQLLAGSFSDVGFLRGGFRAGFTPAQVGRLTPAQPLHSGPQVTPTSEPVGNRDRSPVEPPGADAAAAESWSPADPQVPAGAENLAPEESPDGNEKLLLETADEQTAAAMEDSPPVELPAATATSPLPLPTTAPPRPAGPGVDVPEGELLALINVARNTVGARGLVWDPALAEVARAHNEDMLRRVYFAHVSPEGEDAPARLLRARVPGFQRGVVWSENLSIDASVAQAHAADLAAADDHARNLRNPRYTRVGISVLPRPDGSVLIGALFLP